MSTDVGAAFLTAETAIDAADDEIVLHPISDVHIGAEKHRADLLKAKLAEIMAAGENHRILLLGDLADTSAPLVSKFYQPGDASPQTELELLVKAFKPVADRVDLIIPGNHEERLLKVGVDLTAQFAALIGRPEKYSPLPTVLRYSFKKRRGEESYRARAEVFCHHGYGGGRKEGNHLNRVKELALQKPDCHVFIMGHVHGHSSTWDEVPLGWPVKKRRRVYAITGTYLGGGGYDIKMNLPPSAVGSPRIRLVYSHALEDVIAKLEVG